MANVKHQVIACMAVLLMQVPVLASSSRILEPDLLELLAPQSDRPQDNSLNDLIRLVRDAQIPQAQARTRLLQLLAEAKDRYYRSGGTDAPKADWCFPVSGCDARAIAGGKKHGYVARGYDFYAGNRHGGHPSLDIFIRDRNRDSRDDRTGEPVQVISMTSGVVVAAEEHWEAGSRLRGGKYLWVYDPGNDLLVYYAHNQKLLLRVGDMVHPGDVLAIMGRSGYNAAKQRSPTHLHLTVLSVDGGRMTPVDVYQNTKSAKAGSGGSNRQPSETIMAGIRTVR